MSAVAGDTNVVAEFVDHGLGPFFGTPCGVLAPLYSGLSDTAGLTTVAREDNAVAMAAGAWLSGRNPVVLMQNSGFGQAVNALASLIVPYRMALVLVVSLRGIEPDSTQENLAMGGLTRPILARLGIPARDLGVPGSIAWAADMVRAQGRCAALLVSPTLFGWRP